MRNIKVIFTLIIGLSMCLTATAATVEDFEGGYTQDDGAAFGGGTAWQISTDNGPTTAGVNALYHPQISNANPTGLGYSSVQVFTVSAGTDYEFTVDYKSNGTTNGLSTAACLVKFGNNPASEPATEYIGTSGSGWTTWTAIAASNGRGPGTWGDNTWKASAPVVLNSGSDTQVTIAYVITGTLGTVADSSFDNVDISVSTAVDDWMLY